MVAERVWQECPAIMVLGMLLCSMADVLLVMIVDIFLGPTTCDRLTEGEEDDV